MKKFLPIILSIVSFVIFIASLYFLADVEFFLAVGLTGLLLVHELGHVIALKKLHKKIGSLYFLPFFGAVVASKESFDNANDYAFFKYLGPFVGTVGVLLVSSSYLILRDVRLLYLVFIGSIFNLINMVPITFLDGHGVLRGVTKYAKWLGFLIVVIVGFLILQEYMLALFLLVIFMLFSDSPTEKATGYQLHEVILACIFISIMIFLTITREGSFIWDMSYVVLSLYLLGVYIKATCFDKKQGEVTLEKLPLSKKQRALWGGLWLSLVVVLLAVGFYVNNLINKI